MRTHLPLVALAAGCTLAGLLGTAIPAHAATGEVVVFSTEFQPLGIYTDPTGCTKLPIAAHSLDNQTDAPVVVYADPFCLIPGITVQPGYGAHLTPGSGSFSVN
ncbi:hypothetical protein [Microbispora sp. NPDC046933]|uniref:hypothetical protein n=1 Tax=Microbispora sp. NPDC046933 TaxID=3155618 RepID=UPI003404D48A